MGLGTLWYIKLMSPASPSKAKKWFTLDRAVTLENRKIAPTAVALHSQMYTAFAAGDLSKLRKICADGLYTSFAARIARRERGEKVSWMLVRHIGGPKVVSNMATQLPMEGAAIQQAVVKIKSVQKARTMKPGQKATADQERETEEYIVVQRKWHKWVATEWEVWGTTEVTPYEVVLRFGKEDDPER
jgi:protein MBA1